MAVRTKRIYEAYADDDGFRVLVDRLWPRGMRKDSARLDLWLKDAAPSTVLRQWFHHDPAKWTEFKQRYFAELDGQQQLLQPLLEQMRQGNVTLLYAARNTEQNQAIALQEYLAHMAEI